MSADNPPWQFPLLADRVAVVTGGAGAIGEATCRAFADHGADVVVIDNDEPRTESTLAAVRARGRRAHGIVADLTDEAAIRSAMNEAIGTFGRVDVLVNALGHHFALARPFAESTPADWERLHRVNLLATMHCTHAVLPGMRERQWGRVINFSSVEGIRSMPNAAAYTAYKGAIDSFTKSLGVEVARDNIRVNCVAVDKTKAHQVNFYDLGDEYDKMVPVWIPAGRYAEGDDVAAVVLFLASEMAFWVVGQTIPADGGTLAAGGWYPTKTKWTNSPLLIQYFEDDPAANERRPPALR